MKPSEIQVGKTYRNRNAGLTTRTVIAIGMDLERPSWWSSSERPNDMIVEYEQKGKRSFLYLKSFAAWCGSEVNSAK